MKLVNLLCAVIAAYLMYQFDVLEGFFGTGQYRVFMPTAIPLIAIFYGGFWAIDKVLAVTKSDKGP